jgi:hypothetical protein
MAHHRTHRWLRLRGDELSVRTEEAPLKARQFSRLPSGPARSTTSCSARSSTSSPSATPIGPSTSTGPSTPPASPPASTTSNAPDPPSPATSASNHDHPPAPRRCPVLIHRGSPTVVPHRQTQRAHPCRCPCGAPAGRPLERDAVRHPWPIPNWCSRWLAGRSIVVLRRSGTVGGRASRGCSGGRPVRGLPAVAVVGQVGGSATVVDVFGVERFAALVDKQGDDTEPAVGSAQQKEARPDRSGGDVLHVFGAVGVAALRAKAPEQHRRPRRIRWRSRGRTRRGHGCQRSRRR